MVKSTPAPSDLERYHRINLGPINIEISCSNEDKDNKPNMLKPGDAIFSHDHTCHRLSYLLIYSYDTETPPAASKVAIEN
jgi:hypothetical protein